MIESNTCSGAALTSASTNRIDGLLAAAAAPGGIAAQAQPSSTGSMSRGACPIFLPARGKRFVNVPYPPKNQFNFKNICVYTQLLASACLASQLSKAMLVPAFAVDLAAVMCG